MSHKDGLMHDMRLIFLCFNIVEPHHGRNPGYKAPWEQRQLEQRQELCEMPSASIC